MRRHFIGALALAVLVAGCRRADEPPPTDTPLVDVQADVQMPPVEAPGDTGQRPPEFPPGQPPRSGAQEPGTPAAQPTPRPPATPTPQPSQQMTDSVRGRAVLVGAAPAMQIVLRRPGERDIVLHGDRSVTRALRSVQGLEIQATGHRTGEGEMHVTGFVVRAADGVPAIDGRLEREGDQYVLVTADGRRHQLQHVPQGIRDRVGQRVWIAGSLEREPEAFGVIEG